MNAMVTTLIKCLTQPLTSKSNVIPWSCPVISFGDLSTSEVATLGLNPSNKEFMDNSGNELDGEARRFETLRSLGLNSWEDTNANHITLILDSYRKYFANNPYDGWFRKLDYLISGTRASYYNRQSSACHLDLIPFATSEKWTTLSRDQRSSLLKMSREFLGFLLRDSPVRLLVLNGSSVIENFQELAGICFEKTEMTDWALPRRDSENVKGIAYKGYVREISGIALERKILVLGFNHNIQSSFGVTKKVVNSIKAWVQRSAFEVLA